jgi:hypothetical protein
MPVQRFRSFEEAERALWRRPFDPDNLRIVAALHATARRLGGWSLPRGVFRYRTAAEAELAWEEEIRRRIGEIRKRMKPLAAEAERPRG